MRAKENAGKLWLKWILPGVNQTLRERMWSRLMLKSNGGAQMLSGALGENPSPLHPNPVFPEDFITGEVCTLPAPGQIASLPSVALSA